MESIDLIKYDDAEKFSVEGYMQLLNARPIALLVTDDPHRPFKVGRVDENFWFHCHFSLATRTAAVTQFAALCSLWPTQ